MQYGKLITIESYDNNELTATRHQYEVPVYAEFKDVPAEIFTALSVITKGMTTKLEIEIKIDSQGRYRITKKWIE